MVKLLTAMAFILTHGHMGEAHAQEFVIKSSAFEHGQGIPQVYTCKGKDVSLPLHWQGVPEKAKSLVLVISDPDSPAGECYHWLLYNISPQQTRFTANATALPDGVHALKNSWGNKQYQGPCPTQGTHQYNIRLYALDKKLDLSPYATPQQLLKAIQNHVVGVARLMGTYGDNQAANADVDA